MISLGMRISNSLRLRSPSRPASADLFSFSLALVAISCWRVCFFTYSWTAWILLTKQLTKTMMQEKRRANLLQGGLHLDTVAFEEIGEKELGLFGLIGWFKVDDALHGVGRVACVQHGCWVVSLESVNKQLIYNSLIDRNVFVSRIKAPKIKLLELLLFDIFDDFRLFLTGGTDCETLFGLGFGQLEAAFFWVCFGHSFDEQKNGRTSVERMNRNCKLGELQVFIKICIK